MLEINKIYNSDCFDNLKHLDEESIDIIITDPPYGINFQSNHGDKRGKLKKIKNDENLDWFEDFAKLSYKLLKNNSAFYCFTRYDVYPLMYAKLKEVGFNIKNLMVIQKGQKGGIGDLQAQYSNDCELLIYASKGRRKFNETQLLKTDGRKGAKEYRTRLPNVWFDTSYNTFPKANVNVSNQKDESIIHPTEKNVEIIEWLLKIHSNEGDLVLDPFMGSGTTAIACINTHRKYIGFELDEEYHKLANERIVNYTNIN